MSIKSSFDYLEKCAGAAEHSGDFEPERNRIFGKSRPLQQLRPARQGNFALVAMDFCNTEVGQLFRDHVRVRFQRRNSVGGGKGVELAAPNRLENLLEFLARDFLQSLGKRAREYGDILRVRSEWLAKVVVIPAGSLVDLISGDQIFRVFVLVQKFQRTGEINTGDIVLPEISLMLFK